MEWTFALKPQDQTAWLRHLSRIIFDNISCIQYLTHLLFRYSALEYALNCVDAEDDLVTFHQKIILCKMNLMQK